MKNFLYLSFLFLTGFAFGQPKINIDTSGYDTEIQNNTIRISIKTENRGLMLQIPFTNVGNAPLIITKTSSSSSGAMIWTTREPIFPNQTAYFNIKAKLNGSNGWTFHFSIETNSDEKPRFGISLKIEVEEDPEKERKVYGTVYRKGGNPFDFPDVSVTVKNTTKETRTSSRGFYSINATPNDTLVFSHLGYKSKEIKADKPRISTRLQEEDTNKPE